MGALPAPQGQQRDVVYLREQGHCVVLGTAGSGKTVMAVHRARYLANAPGFGGPTLLVTYNAILVAYLRSLVGELPGVTVQSYHPFARDWLRHRAGLSFRICSREQRRVFVGTAVAGVRGAGEQKRAVLQRPVDFFLDEFDWLAGQGITDFDSYLDGRLERRGRVTALQPADRALVHRVHLRYREILAAQGFDSDWSDLPGELNRALADDRLARPYRHVVVDEGQDFSPEMIRSLVAGIPEDGSLTFFGDYAQQ
ncbi:MAG: AAA family ATPase, partial [Actinomycetes bacterium]